MQSYVERRVLNPSNPQLERLYNASKFARTDANATCRSSAQLFGEYLHAFEDTFAHRDQNNAPYSALSFGLGTGHLTGGENPDFTYNHNVLSPVGFGQWDTNEDRTLAMEKAVFEKLKEFSNPNGKSESIESILYTLKTFNGMHADFSAGNLGPKIEILNSTLRYLGYDTEIYYQKGDNQYDKKRAQTNREESLGMLKTSDYVGTILPSGYDPLPKGK
ncbi:hypothetical protein ACLB1G_04090 [Oxalobacteraceae bacterium A2-2]